MKLGTVKSILVFGYDWSCVICRFRYFWHGNNFWWISPFLQIWIDRKMIYTLVKNIRKHLGRYKGHLSYIYGIFMDILGYFQILFFDSNSSPFFALSWRGLHNQSGNWWYSKHSWNRLWLNWTPVAENRHLSRFLPEKRLQNGLKVETKFQHLDLDLLQKNR